MKKLLTILFWSLVVVVVTPLISAAVIFIKGQRHIGGTDAGCISYLAANKLCIDRKYFESQPFSFSEEFYKSRVFLFGENHGYADNQLMDWLLFTHLNNSIGVRYYVAEMDTTRAFLLNSFLQKPKLDTTQLKEFVFGMSKRIPQQSSRELYDKWIAFYHWNKQLPDSVRMIVVGIDESFDSVPSNINRDSSMMNNFINQISIDDLDDEKFYGYFGYSHVLQTGYGQTSPFAHKLKISGIFPDQIRSLVALPVESECYFPKNSQYPSPPDEKLGLLNVDGPLVATNGINDIKEVTRPTDICIFDLSRPGSPYKVTQRLAGIKSLIIGNDILPSDDSLVTTDFFQHVILIRASKAASKLQ